MGTERAGTTVQVRFSALPAHVRTARLVAAAVARRTGVDEAVLDEVRLAVGEACSRAVDLHQQHCPDEPVTVRLVDGESGFQVEVSDRAPLDDGGTSDLAELAASPGGGSAADGDPERLPTSVGFAVISGLVDDVVVEPSDGGTSVRMRWAAVG